LGRTVLTAAGLYAVLFCLRPAVAQPVAVPLPSVVALEAIVRICSPLPGTRRFAKDRGAPPTVSICALRDAVFWRADLDVDCDGGRSAVCRRDPAYRRLTSATDSHGRPLDATKLPYIVIPLPSHGFDYRAAGLRLGSVVAVLYRGRLVFAVFGDEGPRGIIGEGSYALALALGIDPHPVTGGVDDGVTYIAFTGPSGVVRANEDHAEAERIGRERSLRLIAGR
jgi:hypothetical protein